ncbi:hypothetical protein Are01nite_33870 [Actinoplanes regularis]|nr:hypothetical protein Are01nite_33870 [Actinoplanes regularis]
MLSPAATAAAPRVNAPSTVRRAERDKDANLSYDRQQPAACRRGEPDAITA